MIKQIIAIVLISVGIILWMTYAHDGLQYLLTAHHWVADVLKGVFSGADAGNITRQLITLLAIPVLIGLVFAILYWVVRRSWFPYFMTFVWVVWLVQTSALIILGQVGA